MSNDIPDDAPTMSDALKALLDEAKAAELAASEVALSEEEAALAAARSRLEAAKDAKALAERTRRHTATWTREKAARAACKDKRAIIGSIDLVDLFPVGNSPDPETMPGKGALVLRSPLPARCDAFHDDVKQNVKTLSAASSDLACECVIDPDLEKNGDGQRLIGFFAAYPNIAVAVASKALVLGGSRAAADKRGHG